MAFSRVITSLIGRAYKKSLIAPQYWKFSLFRVDQLASERSDSVVILNSIRIPRQLALPDDMPPYLVLLVQLAQLLLRYPVSREASVKEDASACLREPSPGQQRVSRSEELNVLRL